MDLERPPHNTNYHIPTYKIRKTISQTTDTCVQECTTCTESSELIVIREICFMMSEHVAQYTQIVIAFVAVIVAEFASKICSQLTSLGMLDMVYKSECVQTQFAILAYAPRILITFEVRAGCNFSNRRFRGT